MVSCSENHVEYEVTWQDFKTKEERTSIVPENHALMQNVPDDIIKYVKANPTQTISFDSVQSIR